MTPSVPRVAVIIPAYESQSTIAGCLEALERQRFTDFETIVIDSSRSDGVEGIVPARFPEVRYERSPRRLLPHAARNRGVAIARGEILVFTDPDVYPEPDWLERLVAAHERSAAPVVGGIDCHGRRWLDLGAHLAKFDMWLPRSSPGWMDLGPTASLLCPRTVFDEAGGFPGELMIGDTAFCDRLVRRGHRLWFEPAALVRHDHRTTLRGLLRERVERGGEFARFRAAGGGWGRGRLALFAIASILPVRLAKLLFRAAGNAHRAGVAGDLLRTFPIVLLGHAAWLAGEARVYLALVLAPGRVPSHDPRLSDGARPAGR